MIMQTVDIYQCGCGKNIIILDANLDNVDDFDVGEIQCPICGGEIESFMQREIEI